MRAVAAGAVLLATTVGLLGAAQATPPSKFTADVLVAAPMPSGQYSTRGSAVEIDRLRIRPGGDSGWHLHEGPLLLIVKQGTLTNYIVRDGRCTGSRLTAGRSLREPAGKAHLARNEGTRDVVFYAINSYRKGGDTEVDQERPVGCDM